MKMRKRLYEAFSPASFVLLLFLFTGCSISGIYHPVQSGETLGQLARIYGCSESQIARFNGIDRPHPLRNGQKLFIPGATSLRRVSGTSLGNAIIASPRSGLTSAVKLPAKVLSSEHRKDKNNPTVQPKIVKGQFSWPLHGEILRYFGDHNPFPCNGIEISALQGSSVQAASAGRVIYSNDEITSFGNMIILRHDNDFYTVYAFLQKNFVKTGSFVSKGEKIAISGTPPQGRSSRLYFELRYHKDPVDPTFYLP